MSENVNVCFSIDISALGTMDVHFHSVESDLHIVADVLTVRGVIFFFFC